MALTYICKAHPKNVPAINKIINSAKQYLKQQGIDQWQNHYPNLQSLRNDIDKRAGYVLMNNQQIAGYASLIPGIDPSYLKIQNGNWINGSQSPYVTIHRVAVSNQFRGEGLSRLLMSDLITLAIDKGFRDIRIDTHPDNHGMQRIIIANGFKRRGIIHTLEGGTQASTTRFAYQLIIKDDQ